ncbi:hypothetical protein Tco_1004983 [Tanacetum coccineum]|uniref:Uncharacterized protein n=1 Tax=Tanacetum coccineum TaxID=301880 RepID=A0ABQ5FDL8_9ASTR
MGYHFYNPHENKVSVARYAKLFENSLKFTRSSRSLTLLKASGSNVGNSGSIDDVARLFFNVRRTIGYEALVVDVKDGRSFVNKTCCFIRHPTDFKRVETTSRPSLTPSKSQGDVVAILSDAVAVADLEEAHGRFGRLTPSQLTNDAWRLEPRGCATDDLGELIQNLSTLSLKDGMADG